MPDTDMIQLIARNVRMQMVKRDVTLTHLTFKLKLKEDQVKARLSGKIPFSEDELEMLAPYLDTTFEALHMDLDLPVNGKTVQNGKPPETKEPEKTTLSRQQSAVIALIHLTSKRLDLLSKMYFAKLSGKIDDLGYFLRNNILMKALKEYDGAVSEEEKVVFIDHYKAEYEQWKVNLVSDIDDVTEVALASDQQEEVLAAVLPSTKSRLSQFLQGIVKQNTDEEGKVNIRKVADEVTRSVDHLQRVKGLLDDYLAAGH